MKKNTKQTKIIKDENIEYLLYTTGEEIIRYDKLNHKIESYTKANWDGYDLPVIIETIDNETGEVISEKEEVKTLLQLTKTAGAIKSVIKRSSPIKPAGFYADKINEATAYYFNNFMMQVNIENAINNNIYNPDGAVFDDTKIMNILKKDFKPLYYLLKNLFNGEDDEVIINFLRVIRMKLFTEDHIPVLFLFCAESRFLKGSGSGKNVLITFFEQLFDGLIGRITNKSSKSEFNAHLEDKLCIIFDEAKLDSIDYDNEKERIRSDKLVIRKHQVGFYTALNMAMNLMFSNHHEINFLERDDRSTFLIFPYGETNSLKKYVINKYYNSDFKSYRNELFDCKINLIHLLYNLTSEYKEPGQLTTKAKETYFDLKEQSSVEDIKEFYTYVKDENINKYLIELINEYNPYFCENKIKLIKNKVINYKLHCDIYDFLVENKLLSNKHKKNVLWEYAKEYIKNDYKNLIVDARKTLNFERFKDKTFFIPKKSTVKQIKDIKRILFSAYRKPLNEFEMERNKKLNKVKTKTVKEFNKDNSAVDKIKEEKLKTEQERIKLEKEEAERLKAFEEEKLNSDFYNVLGIGIGIGIGEYNENPEIKEENINNKIRKK